MFLLFSVQGVSLSYARRYINKRKDGANIVNTPKSWYSVSSICGPTKEKKKKKILGEELAAEKKRIVPHERYATIGS